MPDITLPTPGVTTGPGWASTLNTAITEINDEMETGRLSDAQLSAKYAEKLPAVGSLSYDPSGNVTTDQDGTVYTYNPDGTVHTITRGDVTRTLAYNPDGTIASIA